MNLIEDSIKCTSCEEVLNSPVFLPCGHSICKHHVTEITNTKAESKRIECSICEQSYEVPDNGFAPNRSLESMLQKRIEKIDLGEEYNSARDNCDMFGHIFEQLKRMKNDPEMRVHTMISDLRNKIDLRREELKNEIDEEALKMIEKLNEFETECKSNVALIKSDTQLNERLVIWENSLNQWRQDLSTFERNINIWKTVENESNSAIKELQSEYLKLDGKLFLNRLNEFKCTSLFISNNLNYISLEVTELSKYKDVSEYATMNSYNVEAFGIDWHLAVSLEQPDEVDDSDSYIGIYLNASQMPKIGNIKVEYGLKILDQLGMDKDRMRLNIVREFDSDVTWGVGNFIRLKDLMSNYNLYNAEKDSCTVQAIIKKVEWL